MAAEKKAAAKAGLDREGQELRILKLQHDSIRVHILGMTPLILNAASAKMKQELLLPHGRLSVVEKSTRLKHEPLLEYRSSCYRFRDDSQPTRIYFPVGSIKKAAMTATLEMESATKASIARLVWIDGFNLPIFGIPQLYMAVTRSADVKRTPDIRTRAIVPEWACELTVRYVVPQLTPEAVLNLIDASGLIIGIGDNRQEKGAGSFGQFRIVNPDDEEFRRVKEFGGLKAQDRALEEPACFDIETEEMFAWYNVELTKRQERGRSTLPRKDKVKTAA